MRDEEADDTGVGEGTDATASQSRREMLSTAGMAALGGATVAMSASKVPGMLAEPPVERDEIGRHLDGIGKPYHLLVLFQRL